jgi:hypothetical protein
MAIHTTWSVRQDHPVTADDLTPDGAISDDAIREWIARALAAYLEQCPVLEQHRARSGLQVTTTESRSAETRLAPAPEMMVTATATEIFPTSFVVAVRVRPIAGNDDQPLDVTCSVQLEDPTTGAAQPLGEDIRDELIALAHAARHYG